MRFIIFFMLLSFVKGANADILLEPYVGLGTGKSTLDGDGLDEEDSGSFNTIGGRAAYTLLGFEFGADYEIDKGSDFSRNHLSAYVGFQFPVLFKIWGEIPINSTLKVDSAEDADISLAKGMSLGAAFTGLPFVHINLEIESTDYTGEVSDVDFDIKYASYLLSVSMPFEF